jgi:hypothetical protein
MRETPHHRIGLGSPLLGGTRSGTVCRSSSNEASTGTEDLPDKLLHATNAGSWIETIVSDPFNRFNQKGPLAVGLTPSA